MTPGVEPTLFLVEGPPERAQLRVLELR
jgi:hypothetical protein